MGDNELTRWVVVAFRNRVSGKGVGARLSESADRVGEFEGPATVHPPNRRDERKRHPLGWALFSNRPCSRMSTIRCRA